MTDEASVWKRGWIEMTGGTFAAYAKYMKFMTQFEISTIFYAGYPVRNCEAVEDAIIRADGTKTKLCF